MPKILTVLCALLLAGCHIELALSPGGAVETDSGLYGCAASQRCELQVDHAYFSETFRAVAAPGYRFSHWADVPGGFCRGRNTPVCGPLTTAAWLDLPELLPWLQAEARYTLTPVFVAESDVPPLTAPTWQLQSSQVQVNYPVRGNFPADVLAAVQGDGNPLELSSVSGSKPIGKAEVLINWRYETAEDPAGCQLGAAVVSARHVTTVPQLAANSLRLAAWQQAWENLQRDTLQHETGHQQIYRAQVEEFLRRLNAMAGVACADVETEVRRIYAEIIAAIVEADEQYHQEVGSSTSFWAYF